MRAFSLWAASALGPPIFRAWAWSWRVRRIGAERSIDSGRAYAYALWHESIPAGVALHSRYRFTVMISRHHDGELITRLAEGLGYSTARGSSTRGGFRALREMRRAAADSPGLVLTPDGPQGPAHEVAPGAVYLAAVTGRPMVPVGFAARRVWRSGSWDRMVFPKPFTRVVVVYEDPIPVPRQALRDPRELERYRARFAAALHTAHRRAAEALAEDSPR